MLATRPLFFTLLCIVALFVVLVPSVEANVVDSLPAHRRTARMIRKRAPIPQPPLRPPPIIQVGEDPAEADTDSLTETETLTSTDTTTTSTGTETDTTTTTTGTGTDTNTTTTTSDTTTTTSTTSTSETSTSTTSTTTSTSETSAETQPPSETLPVSSPPTTTAAPQVNQVTLTITSSTQQESQTTLPTTSGAASVPKTTITILIVIGASIGGAILLWTIIRKWKFRPSAQFEDRMQPIDWQPSYDRDTLPGSHRRTPSNASHGSFHSGSDHGSTTHGSQAGRGYGATSDHGHGRGGGYLADLPAHDFTAGPSLIGGYADLARGPSPQPPMQENLNRGPSLRGHDNTHYNGTRY